MNEEKKLPKIWHPQQEKILKSWGEAAACYRYMHYQAYCSYQKFEYEVYNTIDYCKYYYRYC